jgi:hypothetical protein
MQYNATTLSTSTKKQVSTMQKNSNNFYNKTCKIFKTAFYLAPILLCSIDAMAAFDLDAGIKAASDPVKKMVNDYYPVGIFVTGAIGALMQQQGDLRDRMMGFGKGSLVGGLTVMAVKAGLGV